MVYSSDTALDVIPVQFRSSGVPEQDYHMTEAWMQPISERVLIFTFHFFNTYSLCLPPPLPPSIIWLTGSYN